MFSVLIYSFFFGTCFLVSFNGKINIHLVWSSGFGEGKVFSCESSAMSRLIFCLGGLAFDIFRSFFFSIRKSKEQYDKRRSSPRNKLDYQFQSLSFVKKRQA